VNVSTNYHQRLRGKVALVTGAGSSKGIGRAIALAFAREGAVIALAGRSGVVERAREVTELGGRALALEVDVADRSQVDAAVAQTVAELGPIEVLVNNAGFCAFRRFLDIDQDLWQRTLDVNVTGYFNFGQSVARHMVEQGSGGSIINVTSISAEISGERKVHYSVSKAADKMLTLGMAVELGRYGIRVNAIAPGTMDTNIVRDEAITRIVDSTDWTSALPLGRIGVPEDIAGAAVFLASNESAYMTGSTLLVDGGVLAGTLLGEDDTD
jgi:NAD(P)-dependent dehydrogenase (short-subunit alcohol dehydrogenase family)